MNSGCSEAVDLLIKKIEGALADALISYSKAQKIDLWLGEISRIAALEEYNEKIRQASSESQDAQTVIGSEAGP